jgi:uncharacterized protein
MKNILFILTLLISFNTLLIAQELNINYYIQGTLLTPEKKSNTLAIIIPGSGPTDRDGNQNFMKNNSLKFLAHNLVENNIATFRYDKRALTMLKKGSSEKQIKKLRFDDFVEDTKKIISYFRERNLYDKIFIIGHSQGSLVGMLASQENINGFISLAGAGKKIDQVIIDQIKKMGANNLIEDAEKTFEIMKSGKIDKNFNPQLANIFNLDTQPFMINWMTYSPVEEIQKLKIPVLIINGTDDLQVNIQEAKMLKEAKPDSQLILIKNMNHVLKTMKGNEPQENAKSYNMPLLKNSSELTKAIVLFIKK